MISKEDMECVEGLERTAYTLGHVRGWAEGGLAGLFAGIAITIAPVMVNNYNKTDVQVPTEKAKAVENREVAEAQFTLP